MNYYKDMNVLILGGHGDHNSKWVRQVAGVFQLRGHAVTFLDYRHWGGKEPADKAYELDQAVRLAGLFNGDYIIVAKSLGTVIAVLGIQSGRLRPARCVFCGFPLKGVLDAREQIQLDMLPPTTFIQHEFDPWGAASDVTEYVRRYGNSSAQVEALPGSSHEYDELDYLMRVALT